MEKSSWFFKNNTLFYPRLVLVLYTTSQIVRTIARPLVVLLLPLAIVMMMRVRCMLYVMFVVFMLGRGWF